MFSMQSLLFSFPKLELLPVFKHIPNPLSPASSRGLAGAGATRQRVGIRLIKLLSSLLQRLQPPPPGPTRRVAVGGGKC